METADAERGDGRHGEYTKDGTVDLRGRPCVRAKGGGWRACSFIAAYEAMERMAYFGIAPNLVIYLTEKLHQGTVASANNVTNWIGTLLLTPILGAYLADAHFGQFWTFTFAALVYLLVSQKLRLELA
ncbi:hypothetical protein HPP92_000266 [Vanilla planifolia]|uniref:Uncharacterized protein n=1 Tax=Vanilla planifolia TaxID=51239 RepID=A0A835RNH9_VANPL|nr:hypothetical protein HPP92_000266 [Vanilla planifolia]